MYVHTLEYLHVDVYVLNTFNHISRLSFVAVIHWYTCVVYSKSQWNIHGKDNLCIQMHFGGVFILFCSDHLTCTDNLWFRASVAFYVL